MNNKISVLIADRAEAAQAMATALNGELFDVTIAEDGPDCIRLNALQSPQVLILDILLSGCDGYHVLNEVRKKNSDVKIMVVSALYQDSFIQRAFQLGANYYMLKPVTSEGLQERVLDMIMPSSAPEMPRQKSKQLDERISNIFISVGIPAHIKGYQFLREAIKVSMTNPDAIINITKQLYPEIANRFNTTASKVERAIRHAIEVAWSRGKIENINTIFGIKAYSKSDKPTNGEFIALLADKLLIETA